MRRLNGRIVKRGGVENTLNERALKNSNSYQFPPQDETQDNVHSCGDALGYNPKYCHTIPIEVPPFKDTNKNSTVTGPPFVSATDNRHIDVIVRIRPKNKNEGDCKTIVWRTSDNTLLFDPKEKNAEFFFKGKRQIVRNNFGTKRPNKNLKFGFDYVYGPESSNQHIFDISLRGLIDQVLAGFNCTIFAYGPTGSGKTYTMLGSRDIPGITVLMAEELFRRLDEMDSEEFSHDITVSYLEVYNETIKDLLNPVTELFIREDGKQGIRIPQLTVHRPQGPHELLKLLRNGNSARSQHATDFNSESSRSHAIFEITLMMYQNSAAQRFKKKTSTSRLFMVDLAGSEKGTFNALDGIRQREGANINKSLLALSNCINALADGKTHIPFRNSKLTRLLKDSLSGNCVTVMIANVSPAETTFEDTHNTLHYANRAKNIKVSCKKNIFSEELIEEAANSDKIMELEAEIRFLKQELVEERRKHKRTQEELQECQMRLEEEGDGDGFGDFGYSSGKYHDASEKQRKPMTATTTPAVFQDPVAVDRFQELMKQKTKLMTTFTESCVTVRVHEWEMNWKKLQLDAAEFLGTTADVSDSYQLQMLNDMNEKHPQYISSTQFYKLKLENVNTEIENVYRNSFHRLKHTEPFESVSFEEFVWQKQQEAENGTLKALNGFYKNFNGVIFKELRCAETHLIHSIKFLKTLELLLTEHNIMTEELQHEFEKIIVPTMNRSFDQFTSHQQISVQEDFNRLQKNIVSAVVQFPKNEPQFCPYAVPLRQESSEIYSTTTGSDFGTGDSLTSVKDTSSSSLDNFKPLNSLERISNSVTTSRNRENIIEKNYQHNNSIASDLAPKRPTTAVINSDSEETSSTNNNNMMVMDEQEPLEHNHYENAPRPESMALKDDEDEIEKCMKVVMNQQPVVFHRDHGHGHAVVQEPKEKMSTNYLETSKMEHSQPQPPPNTKTKTLNTTNNSKFSFNKRLTSRANVHGARFVHRDSNNKDETSTNSIDSN